MKLNATDAMTAAIAIKQVIEKVEVAAGNNKRFELSGLGQSPAQINRTIEISKDPPATVLKYTNEATKQVEFQVPSETALRVYKEIRDYLKAHGGVDKSV
jgi:phosphoserine aminotransferase